MVLWRNNRLYVHIGKILYRKNYSIHAMLIIAFRRPTSFLHEVYLQKSPSLTNIKLVSWKELKKNFYGILFYCSKMQKYF